ncbi:alpha/beta hydrolase [Luteolibacter pohnpeiensis]|uniref:Alpha/beta hydrolase n=2 Tax=Luteolibacter pohnpeiensis TaxID=454153 RepID=A0A934S5I4_9BACT|nr:alpha/beta hydrolase [Luteolibacter pohnpeiensis]
MKTPLLVFHGADDRVIPVSHGQKLVECSASTDKHFELIKGAGHNDLFELAGDRILMDVADFALRVAH